MPFLPPSPAAAEALEVSEPPMVQPNLYLHDVPSFITPTVPTAKSRADALKQRAAQRFERGRRLYRAQEYGPARSEFDAAIDLMLEAAGQDLADRQSYERSLDQMVDAIHRYDLGGFGAAAVEEARYEKAPLEDILQMTFPVDPNLKAKVKEQLAATASQLPLSVNDAVLGYIHYFSNRGRRTIIAGLQRAGRYRPLIRRILDEEGVPQELIHLAQAESGFIPRAMSRMKAGGMWQFLTWRGQQYGLMQSPYTDDRMDPEKATRAAARHLRDLYTQFGDWYLAIAAYNCGPGTVEKAVERTGFADFWELRERRVIPLETTNYVPIILAMTIMEKNAAAYGIDNITPDPVLEYDTIDMKAPTGLLLISDITETPVTELAALNPSLLRGIAPGGHLLHVPKGTGPSVLAALDLVPAERRNAWRLHRVSGGDTLATIGQRYGTSASNIVAANRLESPVVSEGDRVVIPALPRVESTPRRTVARSTPSKGRTTTAAVRKRPGTSTSARKTVAGAASKPAPRKSSAVIAQRASR